MRKITNEQLYNLLNSNSIQIIDIRENNKFQKGHINKSVNIPYRFLISNPTNYLSKQNKYVIICDYGITSDDCANQLSKQGYNVMSVINGISSWRYGLTI